VSFPKAEQRPQPSKAQPGALLGYTLKRLRAFLNRISDLLQSEFPYEQSKKALLRLRDLFTSKLARLERFDEKTNKDVVKEECMRAVTAVFDYLPILGFLLRSTNVRNAFETFHPLLRLSRQVLEPEKRDSCRSTQLILSSEWDYSPLVYSEIQNLPGFVLIGFPAQESENPLVIPLAGHELAHSVWLKRGLDNAFRSPINQHIISGIMRRRDDYKGLFPGVSLQTGADLWNEDALLTWQQAALWALRQAQETFCDFLGLRIFGRSYLCAFAYLLAPKLSGRRSPVYPSMLTRVRNLVAAARTYSLDQPARYEELFADDVQPELQEADSFRLSLADAAVAALVEDLLAKASEIVCQAKIAQSCPDEVKRVVTCLQRAAPAEHIVSLSDILNAAWAIYEDPALWEDVPQVQGNEEKKERTLKELILKNIEVFEYEERVGRGECA
jgi:hypothetical protein